MRIEDGVHSSRSAVRKEICGCNNTPGERLGYVKQEQRGSRETEESSGKYFKPERGRKKQTKEKRKNHGNTGAEKNSILPGVGNQRKK